MSKLLFTRRFNGGTYKFFMNKGFGCLGTYISVETPENCLGYSDTVLFHNGDPYTLHRYLPEWIKRRIKEAVIRRGYGEYIQ